MKSAVVCNQSNELSSNAMKSVITECASTKNDFAGKKLCRNFQHTFPFPLFKSHASPFHLFFMVWQGIREKGKLFGKFRPAGLSAYRDS